jgi:hypothetical protein
VPVKRPDSDSGAVRDQVNRDAQPPFGKRQSRRPHNSAAISPGVET